MVNRKWLMGAIAALVFAVGADTSSAQRPGGGRGEKPSFDRLLEAFDEDASESLSEDEVPGRVWARLSQADADGDGEVTREEFDAFKPGRGGRR